MNARNASQSELGALAGLKVVDAARVLAGPFAGQILGDHGADVLKIESPEGDECRGFGPPFVNGHSAYFNAVNRNKRSVVLDLGQAKERDRLFSMLETADVLLENFKLSTLQSWGIPNVQWFTERYPRLIHCRITGFGDTGPYGGLPGYDAAVQAMAGLLSVNGDQGGEPVRIGVPVVDLTTGMNAAMAVLLALQARIRTGRGQMADVSLYDCAVSVAHPFLSNYLHSGKTPGPTGNRHANIVPYNVYQTATFPLFIAVANDRLFAKLCVHIGTPHLATDPLFQTNKLRVENREALEVELSQAFSKVDGDEFGKKLLADGVPAAPILDIASVAASEHAKYRNMVVRQSDYVGPGIPIKLSDTPGSIRQGTPALGSTTLEPNADPFTGADAPRTRSRVGHPEHSGRGQPVELSDNILDWVDTDYESMPTTQMALLDAAAKTFTNFGVAAASIDVIAAQIGATKGSVYYYYRSKADLFFAVHKRAMVLNLRAQLPVLQDKSLDPVQKLQSMAYRHAMVMMDYLHYQRVTVQGVELHQSTTTSASEREALKEVVGMRDAYEHLFESVLQEGIASGAIAAVEPSLAAKGILGSLNWITVWYRPREGDTFSSRHRIAEQLARQVTHGVSLEAPSLAATMTMRPLGLQAGSSS